MWRFKFTSLSSKLINPTDTQPLLVPSGSESLNHQPSQIQDHRSITSLPVKQLTVLWITRITELVCFTVIFPFINQMIEELEISPDRTQVGAYAGIVESVFSIAQLCTVFFWGRLSDKMGRKPVLLSGLIGLTIGMMSFGLQSTFLGLILARSFAGAMNGNIAVVQSTLAEITDETNQARAFALLPLAYAVGLAFGPLIGGYTAKPADQYPDWFDASGFFGRYPYFLPCSIAGGLNILAVVLGIFYLDETLPLRNPEAVREHSVADIDEEEEFGSLSRRSVRDSVQPPSVVGLLTKPVLLVLISFIFTTFENSAWNALVPLYAYTRIEDGGLGLTINQIGTALSTNGLAAVLVQMILFPMLHRRYGTIPLLRSVKLVFPACFISLPIIGIFTHAVSGDGKTGNEKSSLIAMVGIILSLGLKCFGNMSMVCITLLVNVSAPNPQSLGTINGLAQSCASLARSLAPVVIGFLFSASIGTQALGGNLIWVTIILICMIGYLTTWLVEENRPSWRKGSQSTLTPVSTPSFNPMNGNVSNSERGYNSIP